MSIRIMPKKIATSKSSCAVNSAFWDVDMRADERDCSMATFSVDMADWRNDNTYC
jgi:hypothetical protein